MNRDVTTEDELRWENRELRSEIAEMKVNLDAANAWCRSWKEGARISSLERDEARARADGLAADLATCVRLRDQALTEVERLRRALTCDRCSGEGFIGYPDQQEPCPGCIAVRRELPGGRWYGVP